MANKNNIDFSVKLSEELMKKFVLIAEYEKRTPNNHFLHMLRQNIAYHEKTHGRIQQSDLMKIDLDAVLNQMKQEKSDDSEEQ